MHAGNQVDHFLAELPASTTATIVVGVPANGCAPLENAAEVAGNFVVIDRGGCTFDIKEGFVTEAGAAAVFVVQTSDEPPFPMSGFEDTAVPAGMPSKADGGLIKQNANASAILTTGLHTLCRCGRALRICFGRYRTLLHRQRASAHAASSRPIQLHESWANRRSHLTDNAASHEACGNRLH